MLNNIRPVVSVFSISYGYTVAPTVLSRPVRELSYFVRKKSDVARRRGGDTHPGYHGDSVARKTNSVAEELSA